MSHPDALLTIAEISVALAGFAGIVATLLAVGRDKPVQDLLGLVYVLVASAAGLAFSLLPFALFELGIGEARALQVTGGLLGVIMTGAVSYVIFMQLKTRPRIPWVFWSTVLPGLSIGVALVSGALLQAPAMGFILLLGLIWLILMALTQFTLSIIFAWHRDED